MKKEPCLRKVILLALTLMIIGVNTEVVRNLQTTEPNCNVYNADGSCDICSFRYWKNSSGNCRQVSDQCQTWSEFNGRCTSCYRGYGLNNDGTCTVGG